MGAAFVDILPARDISLGGVGIQVPHRFQGCDLTPEVELLITLPGERCFLARGIVRHKRDEDGTLFGVEFTQLGVSHRERLAAYVATLITLGRGA